MSTLGSTFDTVLAVYVDTNNTLAGLLRVIENDDCQLGVLTSCAQGYIPFGGTYAVQVAGYRGEGGSLKIVVTVPPPSNDNFNRFVPFSCLWSTIASSKGAGFGPPTPTPQMVLHLAHPRLTTPLSCCAVDCCLP